jgi:pyruvate/2-oxoglutarate dehydrogenase complex dihydrolipoamide acyltransferase (E2) component
MLCKFLSILIFDIQSYSTPAVRHLIGKHKLNINKIPATGKNGRVIKEDVINYIASGGHLKINNDIKKLTK